MRLSGAVLVLTGILLLSGCPRPIEQNTPTDDTGTTMSAPPADGTQAETGTELSADPDAPGEPGAGGATDAAAGEPESTDAPADGSESAEAPASGGGSDGADESAADATESAEDTAVTLETDDLPVSAPGQGRYDRRPEEDDALDPSALLGDGDTRGAEPPPPAPLDRESLKFSGRWYVVVVNKERDSYLAQSDNEWVFELNDDSVCVVSQNKDGVTARQSGHWRIDENERLVLQMGPAEREYGVDQPREDVALLIDQNTHAVLFCLRETGGRAPLLQASYDLGGSQLTFKSAGPGDSWRGRLDEPACDLLVRPSGRFVVGSWENERDHGYVLLELSKDGFDGWWWYASSGNFDGQWKSGAE
ncbi:hypothetical protein JW859_07550 [bacterium]|nr:hypothetical protein [bacterium]